MVNGLVESAPLIGTLERSGASLAFDGGGEVCFSIVVGCFDHDGDTLLISTRARFYVAGVVFELGLQGALKRCADCWCDVGG